MGETKLVRNGSAGDHLAALRNVIANATAIHVAVGFAKWKGLGKIIAEIEASLGAGAVVECFVGRDFHITEPRALGDLLRLCRKHPGMRVFVARPDARSTFHPKLYLGIDAKEARVLIGSANLTGGALSSNEEMSLALRLSLDDPLLRDLQDAFATFRSGERYEELDEILLERYRSAFRIAEDARRRAEKEAASVDGAGFDLSRLTSLHEEFRADRGEMAALAKRRADRGRARAVQRRIARISAVPSLSRQDRDTFQSLFRDLVTSGDGHRHLWHSGDIHRRGQAALAQPKQTIALFSLAEAAARLPPADGYARLRAPASGIQGVGINMVSEILCSFAPRSYAVFNGNTAAALRMLGADPPRSVTLFSPETYARVCGVVDAVRRRIGGKDLTDADAFLNWIYQNKVKAAA